MKKLLPVFAFFLLLSSGHLFANFNHPGNNSYSFYTYLRDQFYPGEKISFTLTINKGDSHIDEKRLRFNIKLYRVDQLDSFYLGQTSTRSIDGLGKDSINLLKYCTEINSFDQVIRFDLSRHNSVSKDSVMLGVLPKGAYIVKISGGSGVLFTGFVVSSLGITTKSGDHTFLAYVAESYSGKPVSNVDIKCYYNSNLIASGNTSNGVLFLSDTTIFNSNRFYDKSLLIGKSYDDIIISNVSEFFRSYSNNMRLYVYTNQPVYRTMSTVFYKAIITGKGYNSLTAFANKEVSLIIQGPRNTVIHRDTVKTNENGSLDGSVFIKDEYPLGNYSINLYYGDKRIGAGSFEVEQYKKPEYSVKVIPDKERYGNDEILKATVSAEYFFGSNVKNAEVEYRIYKYTFYKPWWNYSEYSWWHDNNYDTRGFRWGFSQEQIYNGNGVLDDDGNFEIEYKIDEEFKEKYNYSHYEEYYYTDYQYYIDANVTDKSRRTISGSSVVYVTRGEFFLNSRTSKYFYKIGDKAFIDVGAYDFSDKPIETTYEVNIYRSDHWNDKEDRKLVRSLIGSTNMSGKGRVSFDIDSKFNDGYYYAEIKTRDSKNKKISTSNNFSVYTYKPKWYWYNNSSADISILPDKDEYFPGDTCRALITVPDSNVYVLITAEAGEIKYSTVEEFTTGSRYIQFYLDSTYNSNFTLNAVYIHKNAQHNGEQVIVCIPQNKFLNVEIEPSRDIYMPGDSGDVKLLVTDNLGNPVKNAEVSLGVIDESIYYIRRDYTEDIRKAFYQNMGYVSESYFDISSTASYYSRYETIFDRYDLANKYDESLHTIKGVLLDDEDEPVRYANIILNDELLVATTDNFGFFHYQVPSGMYDVGIKKDDEVKSSIAALTVGSSDVNMVLYDNKETNKDTERMLRMKDVYDLNSYGTGTIGGRVIDITDKTPLIGAIIKIVGTSKGTITDDNGEFILTGLSPGVYEIEVSYIGYKNTRISKIKIPTDGVVYFEVNMSTEDEIVTEMIGTTALYSQFELDQSGRLVTYQIDNTGLRGITNIVSTTNGIVTDERGQNINIRGSRSNENIVIVDGISTSYVSDDLLSLIKPTVRKDFRDAVYWSPYITTDENGYATITIKYPDNLTTWRFTSRVITSDRKVGEQRAKVITRKDLLIRAESPRFFRESDDVTITTIVHNYLDTEKRVKVFVKGENLFVKDNTEKYITIKPNSDVKIDWKVRVLDNYGSAKLYAEALTDEESDAMEVLLPLEPKGLKEVIGGQVSISDVYSNREEKINIPHGVEINTTSLTMSVSPSLASVLFTSLDYLIGYPYGCTEQTISRFIPLLIFSHTYDSLNLPFDESIRNKIPHMVENGVVRLKNLQNYDGGWGWWRNDDFDPMMTSYVVSGLALARDYGYNVDKKMFRAAISKLYKYLPDAENESIRANIIYAISLADKQNSDSLELIMYEMMREELSIYDLALLALSCKNLGNDERALEYIRTIETKRSEFGNMVYWEDSPDEDYDLVSDKVLTTSIVLKAIINITPESSLIDRTVDWLIFQMKGGYWRNTRVTSGVISALSDYLLMSDEVNPDYDITVSINGNPVFDKHISREDIFLPAQTIYIQGKGLINGENVIKIEKSGEGKLYFSSTAAYYRTDYFVKEESRGMNVSREYFKLIQTEDEDGIIVFKKKKLVDEPVETGDVILVKTKVDKVSDDMRYFMVEDPIPAGCEVIDDEDEGLFEIIGEDYYSGYSYKWRWWYSDREVRDSKVVFFARRFLNKNEFSYLLRAQIPGVFYTNPAVVSLMYYPQVNGNSGNYILKINDK